VAVKLRLVRMGKKKQPTYRVVAADSRSPRDGRFLEVVGTYAPRGRSTTDDETIITIDHEKALRWLRQGAKPTERVERLLRSSGTLDRLAGGTGAVTASGATESDEVPAAGSGEVEAAVSDEVPAAGSGEAETAVADTAGADSEPA
jgi:small subunit ribosomal protein S16